MTINSDTIKLSEMETIELSEAIDKSAYFPILFGTKNKKVAVNEIAGYFSELSNGIDKLDGFVRKRLQKNLHRLTMQFNVLLNSHYRLGNTVDRLKKQSRRENIIVGNNFLKVNSELMKIKKILKKLSNGNGNPVITDPGDSTSNELTNIALSDSGVAIIDKDGNALSLE